MLKIKIVLLAAGQGKRMKNKKLPKVLTPLAGQPIIDYTLQAIKKSGVAGCPVIVIGHQAQMVKSYLGSKYIYVQQPKALGTGHAVACTKKKLKNRAKNILILYADKPCLDPKSIRKIGQRHLKKNNTITMATIKLPDFKGLRQDFYDHGRIIRDKRRKIIKIVERKMASPRDLKIREVSPSIFCFQADWLWQNIHKIPLNKQGEYFLTDLVQIIHDQKIPIDSVPIKPKEGLGINNILQLKAVEKEISSN